MNGVDLRRNHRRYTNAMSASENEPEAEILNSTSKDRLKTHTNLCRTMNGKSKSTYPASIFGFPNIEKARSSEKVASYEVIGSYPSSCTIVYPVTKNSEHTSACDTFPSNFPSNPRRIANNPHKIPGNKAPKYNGCTQTSAVIEGSNQHCAASIAPQTPRNTPSTRENLICFFQNRQANSAYTTV